MEPMARIPVAKRIASCCLLPFSLLPLVLHAATVQVEGEVGAGRSDNIARTATVKQADTITSIGMSFSVLENSRRMEADLMGDLAWLDYRNGTFNSELVGSAVGRVRLKFIDDMLLWTIEDNFGQTRRDLFASPTPDNRENINYFSTGPDLRIRLGASTGLAFESRFSIVDYQFASADTNRLSARLSVIRDTSATSRISINVAGEHIDPRVTPDRPSYDRGSTYVRYALSGAQTSATVDLGANRIGGDAPETGILWRVELSRQIADRARVGLKIGQEFTDGGDMFRPGSPSGIVESNPATASLSRTVLPFTNRFAEISSSITGRVTTLTLVGSWSDEAYRQDVSQSRERMSLGLHLTRQTGARSSVSVAADYAGSDFDGAGERSDDMTFEVSGLWRVARRLRLELVGQHYIYSRSTQATDAHETRYWLRLRYGNPVSRTK